MNDRTESIDDGVLNVHKPSGPTSRDVVNAIQRCVRPRKVGHAGTLDPLASGVLVVCIGQATRLVEYIQRMRKQYRATFRFGWRSDTDDVEGEQHATGEPPPAESALREALSSFRGEIDQVPPAYSAVKVQGRRAYRLARAQQAVELAPRRVTIWRLELVNYAPPDWTVDIECSSGTYVRSLGRDVAKHLNTSCVMTALTREAVGEFRLADAFHPVGSDTWQVADIAANLQPMGRAVADLPRVVVSDEQVRYLVTGRAVRLGGTNVESNASREVAAFTARDQLVAILEPRHDVWHPSRCFWREPPA